VNMLVVRSLTLDRAHRSSHSNLVSDEGIYSTDDRMKTWDEEDRTGIGR
jgi:hypothetical protein